MTNCSPDLFLTPFADNSIITNSSDDLHLTEIIIKGECEKVLVWLAANKIINPYSTDI